MPPSDFVGSENRDLGQDTMRPAVVSGCLTEDFGKKEEMVSG